MTYLHAKNWESFQHYHDRRPPWVKLYVALLDDFDYIALSGNGKAALVAFWLSCARYGHPLPNNPSFLAERAGIKPSHLRELIASGWVIENDASASTDASNTASTIPENDPKDASTHARQRIHTRASARSREREKEGEGETTSASSPAAHVEKFKAPAHREAYLNLRRAQKNAVGFDHILTDIELPINGGPRYSWEIIGQALMEYAANGEYFSARRMRGYCEAIANPRPRRGAKRSRFDQSMEAMGMAGEVSNG